MSTDTSAVVFICNNRQICYDMRNADSPDGYAMLFTILKTMLFLAIPPAGPLLLLLFGLMIRRKHPGGGRLLVFLAILFLYLLSLPLAADRLIRPLESAYRPFQGAPGNAAAVVVLSGGVQDLSWVPLAPALTEASLARVMTGVELARKSHLPLVATGGSGAIDGSTLTEADAMAEQAVRLGMPRKNIIIENKSRNTWENARGVRAILDKHNIILVTSAFHMKRAAAMFKKQGFLVIPAPTGYRSESRTASWTNLLPRSEHLEISSRAIGEYLSLAWYRITGVI